MTIRRNDFGFKVITTRAITSVFAFGRTCGRDSLIPFAHVVTKCINIVMITAQLNTTNGTVNCPIVTTDFGTCRCKAIFLYRISLSVTIRRNDFGFKVITTRAITSVFAFGRTCGRDSLIPFAHVVTKCINIVMITAQLNTAEGTVSDHIVATNFGTGRIYVVFSHYASVRMTIRRNDLGFIVTTTSATIASVLALSCTRGSNVLIPFSHIVPKRHNIVMLATQFLITNSTVDNHIVAANLGARRSKVVSIYRFCGSMTICRNNLGFIVTTTSATIASVLALSCTRGSNVLIPFSHIVPKRHNIVMLATQFLITNSTVDNHIVAANLGARRSKVVSIYRFCGSMTICRNNLGFVITTIHAIMSSLTFKNAGGGNSLIPFTIAMTKRRNCSLLIFFASQAILLL